MERSLDYLERCFLTSWQELIGDKVSCVVGLSGGADSTALLCLLVRLRSFFSSFSVVAYHLNHGLRETASQDEVFCISLCDRLGIPLVVEREDVSLLARQKGWSLEEAGRERRRQGYERVRKEYALHWICLAHHRDDQVESFFLRLFRGAGIDALISMKPVDGMYLRPCLKFSHRDLIGYLTRIGISWCEDESNKNKEFDRNWIRHEFLPIVERRFSMVRDKVLKTIDFLSIVVEVMKHYEQSLRERVEFFAGGWRLPRELLTQYGVFWVRHLVRSLWREEQMWLIRGSWLETIREYADHEFRELVRMEKGTLFLDARWLTWVRWEEFSVPSRCVLFRGEKCSCGPWLVQWVEGEDVPSEFPKASQTRMFFPLEVERVVLRPVQPGDRIHIGSGHKKVQDIWVDSHVPWLERRWSFVVEYANKVVAVYIPSRGFRVSQEFYLSPVELDRWQGIEVIRKV